MTFLGLFLSSERFYTSRLTAIQQFYFVKIVLCTGKVSEYLKHNNTLFVLSDHYVRPLHSKPRMESYC